MNILKTSGLKCLKPLKNKWHLNYTVFILSNIFKGEENGEIL